MVAERIGEKRRREERIREEGKGAKRIRLALKNAMASVVGVEKVMNSDERSWIPQGNQIKWNY